MIVDTVLNPAEQAAEIALEKIRKCISKRKSFLLEAGAGAGKTYSLIETLKYLIMEMGNDLVSKHQQIACITYTNVAANEIMARTDSHPAIHSSTIHHFCWSLIENFQPYLREKISEINKWHEKIGEVGGINDKVVKYTTGYRKIDDEEITLHHDDILSFMVMILNETKFQNLFTKRYPFLFIDEYQDTEINFSDALKNCFLDTGTGPLIGFFGDHWQKIYGAGCGKIEHPKLERIGKEANFRSVPIIVNSLNNIRQDLPQMVRDPEASGAISIYHTNNWQGTRQTGGHWGGDLPSEDAHNYLENLKGLLEGEGWEFSSDKTKILMLTHNVLAAEQGYRNLTDVFRFTDSFIKKEDPHIAFMVDKLEPACRAYQKKCYGEMFSLLGSRTPLLSSNHDKKVWVKEMNTLLNLREFKTVGDVMDHLIEKKRPSLPESVENKEQRLQEWLLKSSDEREESRTLSELSDLRKINYSEVIALTNILTESTLFSTKHGVKGVEFENVLVVFGRGWNHYNFNQFLEWASGTIPAGKEPTFERNRNLFYVTCSRPKKRLCLLFTQKLSHSAIKTLEQWFGTKNIFALQ